MKGAGGGAQAGRYCRASPPTHTSDSRYPAPLSPQTKRPCRLPLPCYLPACRYTQFVSLHSRPVFARLDLAPLARALNRVDVAREGGTDWGCSSMTDTGPILRRAAGADTPAPAAAAACPCRLRLPLHRPLPSACALSVRCADWTGGRSSARRSGTGTPRSARTTPLA